MVKYIRIAILVITDILIVNISYIAAFLIRFDFDVHGALFDTWINVYANNYIQITVVNIGAFVLLGLYTSMWRYAGTEELFKIVLAAALASLMVLAYMSFTGPQYMPRGVYIASLVMITALVSASRLAYRFVRNFRNKSPLKNFLLGAGGRAAAAGNVTKVMVVGAGDAGAAMIGEIRSHPEYGKKVVVAVDDDPSKLGRRIMGVKIAGGRRRIRALARKHSVKEIIIAIPSASNKVIQEIVGECNRTACKIRILPGLIDIINDKVSISKLRDLSIEDLLGREAVKLDTREISGYLEGKIVMITGGGGSIGSELCRQIAIYRPRRIIALDIYENSVFELSTEMKAKFPRLEFEVVIGSVRSRGRLEEVFQRYKPHVVFHAAAHKHVPLMEKHPREAITNNILGTKNMLDLSDIYAVEKFVMISTDKAVNPVNVMGATKRASEMILQEINGRSVTSYSAVRFGNVLGSNGSVLPIFRKQIEAGGPVTVTHTEIKRYFMTIPEAVQLVIQAGAMAEGGEIFVLDMGDPMKIMDLAENVIKLSGYTPNVDIDIAVTGLRPGEKLYEELLMAEEGVEKTAHDKIYVGRPVKANPRLREMLETGGSENFESKIMEVIGMSDREAREWLKELVPNYAPVDSNLAPLKFE
ncbi:MAG: polysaccharide biosynthesis protein [Clostridiales bacterium]|nr:polysaccharide biosynthesis protein [Clostridiales bacterium]